MRKRVMCGLVLAVCFGCEEPVPTAPRDAGSRDAQRLDDASSDDAALDASEADAAFVDGGSIGPCVAEELELGAMANTTRVSLAAGTDQFAVAWSGAVRGFSEAQWAIVPSGTGEPTIHGTTISAIVSDPAIATRGDGWMLAFHANPDDDFEIHALALERDGAPGDLVRWTNRAGRDDQVSLLELGDNVLAAWSSNAPGSRISVARLFDSNGAPISSEQTIALNGEAGLAIALGESATGAFAAWAREVPEGIDVVVQSLDASGAIAGTARTISTEHNANGVVDVASNGAGGGVAFGAAAGGATSQARGRGIDEEGAPFSAERVISRSGESASDVSVARLGSGFVAAYRRRTEDGARLEIAFTDTTLDAITRTDLGAVAPMGPLAIRVTTDGRIGIARIDPNEAGARAIFARVRCGAL